MIVEALAGGRHPSSKLNSVRVRLQLRVIRVP